MRLAAGFTFASSTRTLVISTRSPCAAMGTALSFNTTMTGRLGAESSLTLGRSFRELTRFLMKPTADTLSDDDISHALWSCNYFFLRLCWKAAGRSNKHFKLDSLTFQGFFLLFKNRVREWEHENYFLKGSSDYKVVGTKQFSWFKKYISAIKKIGLKNIL